MSSIKGKELTLKDIKSFAVIAFLEDGSAYPVAMTKDESQMLAPMVMAICPTLKLFDNKLPVEFVTRGGVSKEDGAGK